MQRVLMKQRILRLLTIYSDVKNWIDVENSRKADIGQRKPA